MKLIPDQNNRHSLNHAFHVFKALQFGELHIKEDFSTGLFAIVAIHSTLLGPALGGCRFRPYDSIDDAIIDALRLARTMSYKAALANLPLGGGKAVLMAPKHAFHRERLFRSFGHFVQDLGGRYITAEDSGTGVTDMDVIHQVTPYVTGHSQQPLKHKNPSPITAFGLRRGIEACLQFRFQKNSVQDCHVAIKGLGQVGYHLAKELHQHGARLSVYDTNPQAIERCVDEFAAQATLPDEIDKLPCDVFAPCALGNAINDQNVDKIQASIIAGSANNQLEHPRLADRLKERQILYAPDYVINAGGLIYVAAPFQQLNEQQVMEKVEHIYETLMMIFQIAQAENLSTVAIADKIAESRLFPTHIG